MQPKWGTSGQRTVDGAARAALVQPWKHDFGRVFAPELALLRHYFRPGFVPLTPFLLVPINTPFGVLQRRYTEFLG